MTNHYTVTQEGRSKVYENGNIRLKVYPKHYIEPIATVKVAPYFWTSASISRPDAASMLLKIRKASTNS